jgi:hypothetical protein
MITPMVDIDGSARHTSAEGQMALATGDTALAQEKFAAAGDILLRNVGAVYKAMEKHLLRFLAATQFYKGGHYQRALELVEKIQARLLPKNVHDLLPPFLRDAKQRSLPGYAAGIRTEAHSTLGGETAKRDSGTPPGASICLPPGAHGLHPDHCLRRYWRFPSRIAVFRRCDSGCPIAGLTTCITVPVDGIVSVSGKSSSTRKDAVSPLPHCS